MHVYSIVAGFRDSKGGTVLWRSKVTAPDIISATSVVNDYIYTDDALISLSVDFEGDYHE